MYLCVSWVSEISANKTRGGKMAASQIWKPSAASQAAMILLLLFSMSPGCLAGRMMLQQAAAAGSAAADVVPLLPSTTESFTCVVSGVMQHPCIVNPAYTFAVGFKTEVSSNVADR